MAVYQAIALSRSSSVAVKEDAESSDEGSSWSESNGREQWRFTSDSTA